MQKTKQYLKGNIMKQAKNTVAMLNAIKVRADSAPNENQRDNLLAEFKFFNDANGSVIIEKASEYIDVKSLAAKIAICEKANSDFVAVYALQKVRKMLFALANNRASFVDGYSKSIISNMVRLQELTNKSALVALSKSIEYTELDKTQEIKRLINVAASTASTQASSTRQMLRLLEIASVTKNKNADEFMLTESSAAKAISVMFAV